MAAGGRGRAMGAAKVAVAALVGIAFVVAPGGVQGGDSSAAPAAEDLCTHPMSMTIGVSSDAALAGETDAEIDQYMTATKALGATSVRVGLDWSDIEPTRGEFDWSATDRVVAAAARHGVELMAIVAYTPEWARAQGSTDSGSHQMPASPAEYGEFASAAAERYADSISLWEIWNEPNIIAFFAPTPDVQVYADMLRAAYTAIHQVRPDAVVLSGGLAPADNKNGSISADRFVKALYDVGAQGYFDGVAVHPYSFPALPNSTVSWNSFLLIPKVRDLMEAHGDGDKLIWITEFGAPTIDNSKGVSEEGQSGILVQGLEQARAWGYVAGFYVFSLVDAGGDPADPEHHFGLFDQEWQPKPAVMAMAHLIARTCPETPQG